MITDRLDRKAMSVSAAVCELEQHAGSQFDPDVVQVLVSVVSAPTAEARSTVAETGVDDDLPLAA